MLNNLTTQQKAYMAGIVVGTLLGGITIAMCYEDEKRREKVLDLESEVRKLKMDKKILERKICETCSSDDESEESEE